MTSTSTSSSSSPTPTVLTSVKKPNSASMLTMFGDYDMMYLLSLGSLTYLILWWSFHQTESINLNTTKCFTFDGLAILSAVPTWKGAQRKGELIDVCAAVLSIERRPWQEMAEECRETKLLSSHFPSDKLSWLVLRSNEICPKRGFTTCWARKCDPLCEYHGIFNIYLWPFSS